MKPFNLKQLLVFFVGIKYLWLVNEHCVQRTQNYLQV